MSEEKKAHRVATRVEWGRRNRELKNRTARNWYGLHSIREASKVRLRRWMREWTVANKKENN
jgi:hypothetical protein